MKRAPLGGSFSGRSRAGRLERRLPVGGDVRRRLAEDFDDRLPVVRRKMAGGGRMGTREDVP